MIKKTKKLKYIISTLLLLVIGFSSQGYGDVNDISLVVDGEDITNLSEPIIENDRMLVPIRFVSESLGGIVEWDNENRRVNIERGLDTINLKIDSQLIRYNQGNAYQLSDVAPKIINDRTYVPVRLVSNALGVGINWDGEKRQVSIDSSQSSTVKPFYPITITNLENGSVIKEKTMVEFELPEDYKTEAYKVKLLLLEPGTSEGYIKAVGDTSSEALTYLPEYDDAGEKALVLGVYDASNTFIAGKVIRVIVDLEPSITLKEIPNYENITEKVSIIPEVNFIPDYINYEIKNLTTNQVKEITERDPFGHYTWYPKNSENGVYHVKAIAVANGKTYESSYSAFKVNVSPEISLSGVKENEIISGPVDLIAKRNFDVNETIFYIKDLDTSSVQELKRIPYGSYTWVPEKSMAGNKALRVTVEDTRGNMHASDWIPVKVDHSPMIEMLGLGPNQTVTSEMAVSYRSNVDLLNVKYVLKNTETLDTFEYVVNDTDENYAIPIDTLMAGPYSIKVIGTYNDSRVESSTVSFKIYKGKLYSSKPIIEKSQFLDFASEMALESYEKTDMSAALQTAQGILETGWGQSVPVDKYTGKFSNNLFGIKGSGTNGSVTSNTWEVYNGVVYRIDDYFRAYHTVDESWQDHKNLLLKASRYSIFRDVMYDSSLGAWAIRRAGYATDPQYPLKLMRIIETYDLKALDKIDL